MTKTTKSIVAISGLLLLAVLFWVNFPRLPAGHQVSLTVMLPLTGPAAAFGEDERLGMEVALDSQTNTAKVNFQDTQGKPDIAASILQQSYDIGGDRVFICSTTGPSMAVLPLLKEKSDENLIFIVATLSSITVDYPNAIRIYPSVDEEIRVLGAYAEKSHFKKIAALCVRNQAGEDAIRTMEKRVREFDGQLIFSDTFLPAEKDFRTVLQKIKAEKPDALLVTGYSFNYVDIFKQMIEADLNIPILAGVGVPLAGLDNQFPEAFLEMVVFPATRFSFSKDDPKVIAFKNEIAKKGKTANYEMAFAYDTMNLILKSSTPGQSPKQLLDAVMSNAPYEGVNGSIKLNRHRDAELELEPCRYTKSGIEKILTEVTR